LLKDEIARLKGGNPKPKIRPSQMDRDLNKSSKNKRKLKRKASGKKNKISIDQVVSDYGKQCRDTFMSLKKTCLKLGVSFHQYLYDRIAGINSIPQLHEIILQKV
jgi:hypothetical protein